MHDTAFRIGKLAMNIYADLASASVLEIGSMEVNGALRDHALPTTNYVGMDLEEGKGVDIVAEPGIRSRNGVLCVRARSNVLGNLCRDVP